MKEKLGNEIDFTFHEEISAAVGEKKLRSLISRQMLILKALSFLKVFDHLIFKLS
jgi:hypothetical protein